MHLRMKSTLKCSKENYNYKADQCFAALVTNATNALVASDLSSQHTSFRDTAQLVHVVHFLVCCVNSIYADLLMLNISLCITALE